MGFLPRKQKEAKKGTKKEAGAGVVDEIDEEEIRRRVKEDIAKEKKAKEEEAEEKEDEEDEEDDKEKEDKKEKSRWIVVKELPAQTVRETVAEDGTLLHFITIEEALTQIMNQ